MSIAAKSGCVPQTLHEWVKKAEVNSGTYAATWTGFVYVAFAIDTHARRGVGWQAPEAGIEPSVGGVGDSFDNALAGTSNGFYKAEVIHSAGGGAALNPSNTRHSNGSTGSIIACWSPSALFPLPRLKADIMLPQTTSILPWYSQSNASGRPARFSAW